MYELTRMTVLPLAIGLMIAALPLGAQEFVPPDQSDDDSGTSAAGSSPFRIGLFGVGGRLGFDFTDRNQGVMGLTLDLGDIGSERFRLRPLSEISFGTGPNSYQVGVDVLWRIVPDSSTAIPYVGLGLTVAGRQQCQFTQGCPELRGNFTLGFEIPIDAALAWAVEYRGEDFWRRNRIFIGLASRRGR